MFFAKGGKVCFTEPNPNCSNLRRVTQHINIRLHRSSQSWLLRRHYIILPCIAESTARLLARVTLSFLYVSSCINTAILVKHGDLLPHPASMIFLWWSGLAHVTLQSYLCVYDCMAYQDKAETNQSRRKPGERTVRRSCSMDETMGLCRKVWIWSKAAAGSG